jgi:glucuronokinase
MIIEARAYARAGLLGNPSDGYFGKTISVIIRNFGARVSLYESPELKIEPQEQDRNVFRNIFDLVDSVTLMGYYGGARLVKATIKKFYEYCDEQGIRLEYRNFTIRYFSTIPRQVGLAGSSAIVTATLRALMQFYDIRIPLEQQPSLILKVETEELGINAGLQDRVIQVYEGCVFMDFNRDVMETEHHGIYERLRVQDLPRLYIAYKTELSKVSGILFNDVRSRFKKGDPKVVKTLESIARCAEDGREAMKNHDYERLDHLIDENFDLRKKIMAISDSNLQLVQTARNCGATAKFSGSGGAIIGTYTNDEMLTRLIIELKKIKARVIKPYIA